jgi:phosphate-selective porin OprO/OprP
MDTKAFPVYANPLSSASLAQETAGGVSWYLNRGIKFMAFFENTTFGAATANQNTLRPERLIATRLQLAF